MRVFDAVVHVTIGFLPFGIPDYLYRGAIGAKLVGHHDLRIPAALHRFSHEFQCGSLVARFCDIRFQDFSFVIHSAPEIVTFTPNFDEDFIKVPLPLRTLPHGFRTTFPDLVSEVSPETIDPVPDCFVANVDAGLVKKVFDVTQL
jgi:hypothetical protein